MNKIIPTCFITFKSHNKTYYRGENKIIEIYGDNNNLQCRNEYDRFERHIHTQWFDKYGNDAGFMHKKYTTDSCIESCKTPTQEYTRTIRHFIVNGFKHRTEEYISKTNPESSYYNESINDALGKLVKMISNGRIIFERKI